MENKALNILLVDDEREVTAVLKKRLTRRGYNCETAANGSECLQVMYSFKADIVVMDVKMPVMDGLETLSYLVKDFRQSKVILLSGHADMQMAVNAMTQGAFAYLMKPVDFDELIFKIEDAKKELELESIQKK